MQAAAQNALLRAEQLEREKDALRKSEVSLRAEMDVMRRCLGQADAVKLLFLVMLVRCFTLRSSGCCLIFILINSGSLVSDRSSAFMLLRCGGAQKAKEDARSMDSMTKDRDRLARELAACSQKLAAAAAAAADQAKVITQNTVQHQQVCEVCYLALQLNVNGSVCPDPPCPLGIQNAAKAARLVFVALPMSPEAVFDGRWRSSCGWRRCS